MSSRAIDRRTVAREWKARGFSVLVPTRARHSVRNTGGTTARWLCGYRHAG